jgi:hypothetical protein
VTLLAWFGQKFGRQALERTIFQLIATFWVGFAWVGSFILQVIEIFFLGRVGKVLMFDFVLF